jgi:spore maturation protein CgeB
MRFETLEQLGHSVQRISLVVPPRRSEAQKLWDRISWKLGAPRDYRLNDAITQVMARNPADVLWCDRPVYVKPETLRSARKSNPLVRIVSYSLDDMMQSHNQSTFYLDSIPLYDLHVTTKSYNVQELKERGAREVLFVDNAFDPRVHFPVEVTAETKARFGGPVGFIGTYEPERAEMLLALAEAGISVRVWGNGWPGKLGSASPNLRIEFQDVTGDHYRIALNSFDINLGFLRKINRDVQTTRSVEIPACGGFLLAERTDEHRRLFREDVEAAYFSTKEELIQKVKYFLFDDERRRLIALNGFQKAVTAPYTYEAQLHAIFQALFGHS